MALADDFKRLTGKNTKTSPLAGSSPTAFCSEPNQESRRFISLSYLKKFRNGFITTRKRRRLPKPPPFSRQKLPTNRQKDSIGGEKTPIKNSKGSKKQWQNNRPSSRTYRRWSTA